MQRIQKAWLAERCEGAERESVYPPPHRIGEKPEENDNFFH